MLCSENNIKKIQGKKIDKAIHLYDEIIMLIFTDGTELNIYSTETEKLLINFYDNETQKNEEGRK